MVYFSLGRQMGVALITTEFYPQWIGTKLILKAQTEIVELVSSTLVLKDRG